MASPGKRNQGRTWTAFCSLFCMPELLPKVGVLLACFFDRYKNFKFINWYLDVTIEYKYNVQCFCLKRILNIIIQAGIFREYRNKCFWRPKCFGKAIPQIMTLWILSGKGAVQIMPLRKLGGKFHFLLRFCTRKQSKTYKFPFDGNIACPGVKELVYRSCFRDRISTREDLRTGNESSRTW